MKTEKQKAAEGLLYDANNDPELQQEMLQTRCLLHEYNLLPPDRTDERDRLIRRIVHMGEGGCIISPFYCEYGYHIRIGRNFFANTNLVILDGADVTIGDNVFIAPHVGIYTAGHPLDIGRRNAGLRPGVCLPHPHRQQRVDRRQRGHSAGCDHRRRGRHRRRQRGDARRARPYAGRRQSLPPATQN